jgi:soluble lytic murein transglycosylase-like protein
MLIMKYCLLVLLCLLQVKLLGEPTFPNKFQRHPPISSPKAALPHIVKKPSFTSNDLWVTTMAKRLQRLVADPVLSTYYVLIVKREAERVGLDPSLVLSIILVESKFNPYAISTKGAIGFMQIMPFWINQFGHQKEDLFDVNTNVRYGCIILKYYLELEHQNISRALARYNGSLGTDKYSAQVLEVYSTYWYH